MSTRVKNKKTHRQTPVVGSIIKQAPVITTGRFFSFHKLCVEFNKFTITKKIEYITVIIGVVVSVASLLCSFYAKNADAKQATAPANIGSINAIGQNGDNTIYNNMYVVEHAFIDSNGDISKSCKDIKILQQKIIDENKGYIKFSIDRNFLNSTTNHPITLQYRAGSLLPVSLTFKPASGNSKMVVAFPGRERECIITIHAVEEIDGLGRIVEETNPIYEIYYSRDYLYFVTVDRAIRCIQQRGSRVTFEGGLPLKFRDNFRWVAIDDTNHATKVDPNQEYLQLKEYFSAYAERENVP